MKIILTLLLILALIQNKDETFYDESMKLSDSKSITLNKKKIKGQKANKYLPISLGKYHDSDPDKIIKEVQHEFTSSEEEEEKKTQTNQGRKK